MYTKKDKEAINDYINFVIKSKSKKIKKDKDINFRNNYKNYQYDYEEDLYEPRYE